MSALPRKITIAGGGLAGLSLGLALRARNIPVAIHEAGTYPRHRVCGEFLCGDGPAVVRELAGEGVFADAVDCHESVWHDTRGGFYHARLPRPAVGLSRYALDAHLARMFHDKGGELHTETRLKYGAETEGQVWTCGRRRMSGDWTGLKQHYRNLPLEADLEMHTGRRGYLGLCKIEGGRVNACGLFKGPVARKGVPRARLPEVFAREIGLGDLADRLAAADAVPASLTGISQLGFGRTRARTFTLGDAYAQIPPFTGNGMSMALEAGRLVAAPLDAYARGRIVWAEAMVRGQGLLRRRFAFRLGCARLVHPCLWHPRCTPVLRVLASCHCLPFGLFFRLTR